MVMVWDGFGDRDDGVGDNDDGDNMAIVVAMMMAMAISTTLIMRPCHFRS